MKSLARAALRAAVVVTALAGHAAAHPDDPKFWSWGPVQGDAATLSRFRQMVSVKVVDVDSSPAVYRTGYDVGWEAAEEVHARMLATPPTVTSSADVWVLLNGLNKGNSWNADDIANGWALGPALSFHAGDNIQYNPYGTVHDQLAPWFDNGVPEMSAWIDDLVEGYQDYQAAHSAAGVPDPSRFFCDNEVSVAPWNDNDLTETVKAFHAIKTYDSRWNDDLYEIAGFPGLTLEELYIAAGSPSYNPSLGIDDTANRVWYTWYSGVCTQAQDAAMAQAVYGPLHSAFGAWCGDYDASVILDGAGSAPYGGDRAFHGSCGAGADWLTPAWTGSGHVQNPVLYSVSPDYVSAGWGGDQDEATLQRHRDYINACFLSFFPSTLRDPATVIPWITLPGLETEPCGDDYVFSFDAMRDLLAMLRSRGIAEMIIFAGDSGSLSAEWDSFLVARDFVWGADEQQHGETLGTLVSDTADALLYGLDEVMTIESAATGLHDRVVVEVEYHSTFNVTAAPTAMEVHVEAFTNGATVETIVKVWNHFTSDWDLIAPPAYPFLDDDFEAARMVRHTDSSADTPDHVGSQSLTDGEIRVQIEFRSYVPFTLYFDQVQVIKKAE